MDDVQRYCLGLIVEETAEANCHAGRALRFGLDTPGQDGVSEREGLARELGDVWAATRFAARHGLVDMAEVEDRAARKLRKLLDPANTDNLGRPLAPQP